MILRILWYFHIYWRDTSYGGVWDVTMNARKV